MLRFEKYASLRWVLYYTHFRLSLSFLAIPYLSPFSVYCLRIHVQVIIFSPLNTLGSACQKELTQ